MKKKFNFWETLVGLVFVFGLIFNPNRPVQTVNGMPNVIPFGPQDLLLETEVVHQSIPDSLIPRSAPTISMDALIRRIMKSNPYRVSSDVKLRLLGLPLDFLDTGPPGVEYQWKDWNLRQFTAGEYQGEFINFYMDNSYGEITYFKEAENLFKKNEFVPRTDKERELIQYVRKYKQDAIRSEATTGFPWPVTLAQGFIESGGAQSKLAKVSNNHFGIKCTLHRGADTKANKKHCVRFHDDDADDRFLIFSSPQKSFEGHINVLRKPNYAGIFDIPWDDKVTTRKVYKVYKRTILVEHGGKRLNLQHGKIYTLPNKLWITARLQEGGYATNKHYAQIIYEWALKIERI
jgi:hypothetical protein